MLTWLLLLLLSCGKDPSPVDTDPGGSRGADAVDDTGGGPGGPGGPGGTGGDGTPAGDSAAHTGPADTAPGDTEAPPLTLDYPDQRVGIFYLAWHAFAAQVMQGLPEADRLVVEDAIRDTSLSFAGLLYDRGLYDASAAFHYHLRPAPGFYCLYRQRPDEALAEYDLADCPDIAATAALHAEQLWSAGVDFVYMDLTNLPTFSEFGDVIGLRPLEVLLEEWGALRAAGVPTPQIAAWVPAVEGEDAMVLRVLEVYREHWDSDVLFRQRAGDAPALFVVGEGEPGGLDAVRAAGVTPVPMWGNLDAATLAGGVAGWMQPCTSGGAFTTLVDPAVPCEQSYATGTPLGTVVSVSRSYQIGYASLPMQASGRLGGLTFQKQMETALAVRPDVLLINAWNEHLAQPQPNPYDPSLGGLRRSMGVTDVADDSADWLWVDMYGEEFSRDLEPSAEGDEGYQLMASCLRVWRSGATACDDAGEACCQLADGVVMIRSLRERGGATGLDTNHLLSNNPAEYQPLLDNGGWEELCNPIYGPPGLCGGGTGDGPFMLYPDAGADRAALYRCYSGANHFFSLDPSCEGREVDYALGYLSTIRTSETPRPLRRCYNSAAVVHFHWLDEHCPEGYLEEAILGYVR